MKILAAIASFSHYHDTQCELVVRALLESGHDVTVIIKSDIDKEICGIRSSVETEPWTDFKTFSLYCPPTFRFEHYEGFDPYKPGSKDVMVLPFEEKVKWHYLTWACRKTITEHRGEFDLYIMTEDDIVMTRKAIDSFIEADRALPTGTIPALWPYEVKPDKERLYPEWSSCFGDEWKLKYDTLSAHGGLEFIEPGCLHQCSVVLTQEHLEIILGHTWYDFMRPIRVCHQYGIRETNTADIFYFGVLRKMLCLTRWEDLLLWHVDYKHGGLNDRGLQLEIERARCVSG